MERQIKQVEEFHNTYGVRVVKTPQLPALDRRRMRQRILEEEILELKTASLEYNDLVGTLDALVDAMYIIIGTAHEFGLADKLIEAFDEVHRSNMSKLDENGRPVIREDGKILKGKNFTPPDLKSIIYK